MSRNVHKEPSSQSLQRGKSAQRWRTAIMLGCKFYRVGQDALGVDHAGSGELPDGRLLGWYTARWYAVREALIRLEVWK